MSSNKENGAVYVQTNEAENTVIAFRRGAEGALERIGAWATGGPEPTSRTCSRRDR